LLPSADPSRRFFFPPLFRSRSPLSPSPRLLSFAARSIFLNEDRDPLTVIFIFFPIPSRWRFPPLFTTSVADFPSQGAIGADIPSLWNPENPVSCISYLSIREPLQLFLQPFLFINLVSKSLFFLSFLDDWGIRFRVIGIWRFVPFSILADTQNALLCLLPPSFLERHTSFETRFLSRRHSLGVTEVVLFFNMRRRKMRE